MATFSTSQHISALMRRFLALVTMVVIVAAPAVAQKATLRWKMHNAGKVHQVINNTGTLNTAGESLFGYSGLLNCEFPAGSGEEHISNGGTWVAGIRELHNPDSSVTYDTLCSMGYSESLPTRVFYPSAAPWDSIYEVHRGDTVNIGDPAAPYLRNYIGVSDQDFVCRYTDYGDVSRKVLNHTPMYLDIVQTSYAWSSSPLDEIIVQQYAITSVKYNFHKVYLGSWVNSSVGFVEVDYGIDDFSYFVKDKMLAITEDIPGGPDGNAISPLGRVVIPPPKQHPTDSIRVSYKWYDIQDGGGNNILPSTPIERYQALSDGVIKDRQPEIKQGTKDLVGVGPYELPVGDTLHFTVVLVLSKLGLDGIYTNADIIQELIRKNFKVPAPPPKPPVRFTADNKKVTLNWRPEPGDVNPELYTDPNRTDTTRYPFEGYRVYKSTRSANGPWTLLAEFDLAGDAYEQNTGLQYTLTDNGLLNNIQYYYSVTAFSMPDKNFPSQESSINANAVEVSPGPFPPKSVGEVAVVPNPYRGDIAYYSYNPPWEKPQGSRTRWMEQDRRIQFINLPARCEIKVYTLAGDLVVTLRHDDPNRGYEDWNLTSSVGQAVSSGIYLFTAQDLASGNVQVGKFVIIK